MLTVFIMCKKLIEKGKTEGLIDKMDAFLANDRLTVAEYNELLAMIGDSND